MLAGLDARQLAEMYAFANIEPLDEPLQKMLADVMNVLAQVNGNKTTREDFMLVRKPAPKDDAKTRTLQIVDMFATAARKNAANG